MVQTKNMNVWLIAVCAQCLLLSTSGAGELLLHWRFGPDPQDSVYESISGHPMPTLTGSIEADASGRGHAALLRRGDFNMPYPERLTDGVAGHETGSLRLEASTALESLRPLVLPESWTLSFWIKDERPEDWIPGRLSLGDILSIQTQTIGLEGAWHFRRDPDGAGVNEEWYTGYGEEWEPIRVPAFWAETHVEDYLGYGWYRTRFHVPEAFSGMEHEIHFGGVDEQAWVYVNGALVGEQSVESTGMRIEEIWDKPFSVTIGPEHLRAGDGNVLVVRTHAAGGNAGIFRPVTFLAPETLRRRLDLDAVSGYRISSGAWEHVALTIEPGKAMLYINGILASVMEQDQWPFNIRHMGLQFTRRYAGAFIGLLDDVRLYAGVLSEADVADISRQILGPDANWMAAYDEELHDLIRVGMLSRKETDHFIALGAPDRNALRETLDTSDVPERRSNAIWALGVLGGYEALAAIIPYMDKEGDLADEAVSAMRRLQDLNDFPDRLQERPDDKTVALLGTVLREAPDIAMQKAAIATLGKIGDRTAADDLTATAYDAQIDLHVRRAAAKALDRMGVAHDFVEPFAAQDWPMWRYDATRSAAWPGELDAELHLQWSRELPPPRRAWRLQQDNADRLDFDVSFAPVAADGLLFVPSSSTDSVSAYRLSDGHKVWRFSTDGPVRLAPAYSGGRLYIASDDGHLYCVDATEGRLLWRFRGGPSDHRLLGNERIINFWAARGAPLVDGGIVYFAAGLWPLHGVFLYALNADDGSVVWVNDTTGSDFVRIPRGSVFGGLVPQGYLAISTEYPEEARTRRGKPLTGDYLFVAGGRGGPAFLCRQTGSISADLYDVTALLNDKGSGGYAVHGVDGGGIGKIENSMLRQRADTLTDYLDAPVFYKLAVGDQLVVVTETGTVYAFGPQPVDPVRHAFDPATITPGQAPWPGVVRELLDRHDDDGGYALVLGAGSGNLFRELLLQSRMHVVLVEPDPDKVRLWRDTLIKTGHYGRRAAVIEAEPAFFSVQPYLFSLLASEDPESAGLVDTDVLNHTFNLLRPYGGVAWFGGSREHPHILADAWADVSVDQVSGKIAADSGSLIAWRDGPLTGAGQWTHQYHDGANTLLSKDRLAKLPLGVLWFGGPNNHNVLGKHSRGPRPQIAGGRQIFIGVHTLAARCVYTGRSLWEREFRNIGSLFDTTRNLPGTSYIGSPFVTMPDRVYLRYQGAIHCLSAVNGETLDVFPLTDPEEDIGFDWGHISVQGDFLITTREPLLVEGQEPGDVSSFSATASARLRVMDRRTGEIQWERTAKQGFRHNAIVHHADTLHVIDGLPESQLDALARRGLEPETPARLYALRLTDGTERWNTEKRVMGTFMTYSAEHDLLIEGGNHDIRHGRAHPEGEPTRALARRGADGTIVWEHPLFHLPAAVRNSALISASRFRRSAVNLLTGDTLQRTNVWTGKKEKWTYTKSKNCDSFNASQYLMLFRTTYAGFFDLEYDSGIGFFSGFRSGCTANMIAAEGILNALDYTRLCNCAYPHQTSLAMIHMPNDPHIELWTTGAASAPGTDGHGINYGAPGRRVDRNGSGVTWFPENGSYIRHPSVIRDAGPSFPWVLASWRELAKDEVLTIKEVRDGPYTVRLHWAELRADTRPGQRVFDVFINGTPVAHKVDITDTANGTFRGIVKEFPIETGGRLEIRLRPAADSDLPSVLNGLEVIPAT